MSGLSTFTFTGIGIRINLKSELETRIGNETRPGVCIVVGRATGNVTGGWLMRTEEVGKQFQGPRTAKDWVHRSCMRATACCSSDKTSLCCSKTNSDALNSALLWVKACCSWWRFFNSSFPAKWAQPVIFGKAYNWGLPGFVGKAHSRGLPCDTLCF